MKTTIKYPKKFLSNPFISTFEGLDKLLKINAKPAIILFALLLLLNLPSFISNGNSKSANMPNPGVGLIVFIALLVLFFAVLSIIIGVFLNGMADFVTYKSMKGQATSLKEAFAATKAKFWVILWTILLSGIRILFGFIFFIIPGIRAALRYQMVLLPIFDEDMSASQSIKKMKDVTKGHLMEIFGINFVAMLLFPVAPLLKMGAQTIMYPQLIAVNKGSLKQAPTHWLNYLGLYFLLGLLALGTIFGILLVAVFSNL